MQMNTFEGIRYFVQKVTVICQSINGCPFVSYVN